MSDVDLENELLGLAEDDPEEHKKRHGKKSHGFMEDSEDDNEDEADMDLDDDSDGDDAFASSSRSKPRPTGNPYPLEGKYIDEDDRDYLDSLPEIEREEKLAARQEEIQKYKDSAQLDAMYKMAGMGDEDEDDIHIRKKRKHTSVTNEATRAMAELKNRRKAKDERAARRALEREKRGGRSPSVASQEDMSSEEGEISPSDAWRAGSPSHRVAEKKEVRAKDLDSLPASCEEVNSARLSRYELVEMMYKDNFEQTIKGAYVRLMSGETDENGNPKYRIQRIEGLDPQSHGRYSIEYKGRQVSHNRGLVCKYGKLPRLWRIADVSNGDFEETEFGRYMLVLHADGIKLPRRSELKHKHDDIAALRDRPMTEDEVNRQVEARKKANPQALRQKTVIQISQLMSSKQLALRRNDPEAAEDFSRQIEELGGDPATGQLIEGDTEMSEHDLRLQRINEQNRRKTKDNMARAHEQAIARRRREEAIVRSKKNALKKEDSAASTIVETLPRSGLRKGETPQQYVARTIVLNLGDF